jgi:hypothetical protein
MPQTWHEHDNLWLISSLMKVSDFSQVSQLSQPNSNPTQLNTKLVWQGYWCLTHHHHHPTPHKLLDHFKTTLEADFRYTTLFPRKK